MNYNAAKYFSAHPTVDVFYITSDGQGFYTEDAAWNHAHNTLKDDVIHTAHRNDEEVKLKDRIVVGETEEKYIDATPPAPEGEKEREAAEGEIIIPPAEETKATKKKGK